MTNVGQIILTVVGAAVGFVASGFSPAGALQGAYWGYTAGQLAFPTKLPDINGPRLNDLHVQVSTSGLPIPLVYGRFRIAGNVIWSTGLIETVTTKETGGRGSQSQTTYSYRASFAVGLCEGPIVGVSRIWADGELIYNGTALSSDAQTALNNAALVPTTEPTFHHGVAQLVAGGLAVGAYSKFVSRPLFAADIGFLAASPTTGAIGRRFYFYVVTDRALTGPEATAVNAAITTDQVRSALSGATGGTTEGAIRAEIQAQTAAAVALDTPHLNYLGTAAQNPDPTIESYLGAGNVPAFRGLAYIVFTDYQLERWGNRIPNFTFEVISAGSTASASTSTYAQDVLDPWDDGSSVSLLATASPAGQSVIGVTSTSGVVIGRTVVDTTTAGAIPDGSKVLSFVTDTSITLDKNLTGAGVLANDIISLKTLSGFSYDLRAYIAEHPERFQYQIVGSINGGIPAAPDAFWTASAPTNVLGFRAYDASVSPQYFYRTRGFSEAGKVNNQSYIILYSGELPHYTDAPPTDGSAGDGQYLDLITSASTECDSLGWRGVVGQEKIWWTRRFSTDITALGWGGIYSSGYGAGPPPDGTSNGCPGYRERNTGLCPYPALPCESAQSWVTYNIGYACRRVPRAPANPCQPESGPTPDLLPDNPAYCLLDGRIVPNASWTKVTGSFYALQSYSAAFPLQSGSSVVVEPLGPIILSSSSYNNSTFWTDEYNKAVASGTMPGGYTYGNQYPVAQAYAWQLSNTFSGLNPADTTVAAVVSDICLRAGLTAGQIDVTQLASIPISGYAVNKAMSMKHALASMMGYAFFDAAEAGGKLIFKTRGQAAVASLVEDDVAAFESGGSRPSTQEILREQEVSLPRQIRLHYANIDNSYQLDSQYSPEYGTASNTIADVEMPVAMSATQAARIADIMLHAMWVGRESQAISVAATLDKLAIVPGDSVNLTLDGFTRRCRLISSDYRFPGMLQWQTVRDDQLVYTSALTGRAPQQAVQVIKLAGPTKIVLLDIPALTALDNDGGFYVAAYGTLPGWKGASMFGSTDGGATYTEGPAIVSVATTGQAITALASGPSTIWDEGNTLKVILDAGTLASVSATNVLDGQNLAALEITNSAGAHVGWELLQFQNATLNADGSYTLQRFLRGRKGSEIYIGNYDSLYPNVHKAGDYFVLLNGALTRDAQPTSLLHKATLQKAVTNGTLVQNATGQNFTPFGVDLMPYAPAHITGSRNGGGDLAISWVRRDRFSIDSLLGPIPLSEVSESYEIHIVTAGGVDIAIYRSSSPTLTYTAAQQTTDLGAPASTIYVRIFQMSAAVGRGFPGDATL